MTGIIRRSLSRLRQTFTTHQREGLIVNPEATSLFFMAPSMIQQLMGGGGVTQPYANHAWVYACISHIAQSIAGVPLLFFTGSRKDKKLMETGPLVDLFESPNPTMSGQQLIEATKIYMGITGEAFWLLARNSPTELPKEIWALSPSRFTEHVDKQTGLIDGWVYKIGTKTIPLQPHEVVFFKYFNPDNEYRGLSPLSAAKQGVDQDYWAAQYNGAFFQNSAQPGGVVTVKGGLTDEQFLRLKSQWQDRHGGTKKAHRVAILEGDATYTNTGLSQKDMDFLKGREFNREEILAVFKMPQSELGLLRGVQFAWAKQAELQFWRHCLEPKMSLMESAIWSQLHSQLPGTPVWVEFDRKAIAALQADRGVQTEIAQKYFSMGVPFNQINEVLDLGFEAIDGGDVGYLPFNLSPVGSAAHPPAVPPPGKKLGMSQPKTVLAIIETLPRLSLPPASPTIIIRSTIARRTFWQQYSKLHSAYEKKVQGRMKRYFYDQRKDQLALVAKLGKSLQVRAGDKIDAALFPLDAWNENLKKIMWTFYQNIGEDMGKTLIAELGADPDKFILADTPAIDVLKDKLIKVVDINEVTREKLRDTLMEGMGEVETVHELQNRVREVYNFTESRSLTIARTETGQAAAPARAAAMEMLGVTRQEWTTAGDNDVREIHAEMDGQVVDLGEAFSNGLLYPCDPTGGPEETINCRCVAAPVIEKD